MLLIPKVVSSCLLCLLICWLVSYQYFFSLTELRHVMSVKDKLSPEPAYRGSVNNTYHA